MAKARKVEFTFDPFDLTGTEPPRSRKQRKQILEEIADEVVLETLGYVDGLNSPVQGHGKFPGLTKKYSKIKRKAGRPPVPDLTLKGEMLPMLRAEVKGNKIVFGIPKSKQGAKADGHCNHSGESELPLRRFIPSNDEKETFKQPILNSMKKIIRENE